MDTQRRVVLLIEDNSAQARLTEQLLKEADPNNFQCLHVGTIQTALKRVETQSIDVILLDLSLPDAQGLEGLHQIRAAAPKRPILVLTGADDESLALRALEQGAQDYLVKGEETGKSLVRAIRYAAERQRSEERMIYLATHDALTGLANRARFREQLDRALERAGRHGYPVHVIVVDLDGLKSVNDQFGHEAGDRLLEAVASRLRTLVRSTDLVARMGGDEFVLAFEETGQPQIVRNVARDIQAGLAVPFEIADRSITISASVGNANSPYDGITGEELLKAAVRSMYGNKHPTDKG